MGGRRLSRCCRLNSVVPTGTPTLTSPGGFSMKSSGVARGLRSREICAISVADTGPRILVFDKLISPAL